MKHTKIFKILLALFAVVLCFGPVGLAEPMGTAFTYQGRLIDTNEPADGIYDLQFLVCVVDTNGNWPIGEVNKPGVDVIDGYFTVELDFGDIFYDYGEDLWLEIGVRPGDLNDPNVYTFLSPLQKITPTPYALYAKTAGSGGGDGDIGGSGTANRIAKFTSGNAIGDSVVYESSGNIGIGTTSPANKLEVNGDISAASVYKIAGSTVLSVPGTTNTFVGVETGANNTTGNYNTFSGWRSGYHNTTGNENTFTGLQTGLYNTTGSENTFLGMNAGISNTTGSGNTFSGFYAGFLNTTGITNTFLGSGAGYSNTTGYSNVFLGYQAGYDETGSRKLYIANSSANPPLIYGDFSTGSVGIGTTSPATKLDVTGVITSTGGSSNNWNTAYGWGNHATAGYLTAETDPTVLASVKDGISWGEVSGIPAGFADGIDDVGAGDNLGNHTATQNIKLSGYWLSGDGGSEGVYVANDGNVGIGTTSPNAKLDVSGDISTASVYKIGGNTVLSVPGTQKQNTFVGVGAGVNNTGTYNTFLGFQAGYSNTTGSNNTFSGLYAGYSNTTGNDNTFSGLGAGYSNTTGPNNTFSGYEAGFSNTTGSYNTFLGAQAGRSNTTAWYNTFLGDQAGYSNTTGNGNTFSGYEAGFSNTTGPSNTFSGYFAGYSNTTGNNNTFSGYRAGRSNTTGGGNTFSGCEAGYSNITGTSNTFSGNYAGYSNNTGSSNTFSGFEAGYSNTTGNNNTFSGYFAGFSNTTGSGNVFLGHLAGYQANETGSNKLYIANYYTDANTLIYGDFSAKYVGINTTTPARNLHINDVMRLQPRATAPSSPAEGDIYYDSVSHNLMVYNGTIWKPCF